MELTVTILAAVMVATTAFYLLQVYKFDLQMMQQNSYRNERYFKWWRMSKDYASMSRISDLAVFLLLVSMFPKVVTLPIAIIVFAIKAAILLKKKYKKPLVMTKRVWRLLSAMIVATLVVAALSCSSPPQGLRSQRWLCFRGACSLCATQRCSLSKNQSTTATSTTRAASSVKCRR